MKGSSLILTGFVYNYPRMQSSCLICKTKNTSQNPTKQPAQVVTPFPSPVS